MSQALQHNFKWEQKQRLVLLEATVFWSGGVTTNALTEYFGISRIQASKDLTLYQKLCPDNIRYNKYLKRYVIQEKFQPAFMDGSADEFLQVLKIQHTGSRGAVVSLAGNLPVVEIVEPVFRRVDRKILRMVNQAIVSGSEIRVIYQSMSRMEPAEHRLCPHALVYDGMRWHFRAFSQVHQQYRDFVLARVLGVEYIGDSFIDCSEDRAWHSFVSVRMGPHPMLSDSQERAIEFDYGMVNGMLECDVRCALVSYFLRAMRIGADDMDRDANVQQIVLLNREELKEHIVF